MSANGEIEIAVTAEGADQAAQEIADDGGDEGGGPSPLGGGGGGGGGRRGGGSKLTKAGSLIGVLLALLGPMQQVLNSLLSVLNAFLAPVAVMLLRLFQPVLRELIKLLPAWFNFMNNLPASLNDIGETLVSFFSDLGSALVNIGQAVWEAFVSGASWLANGAVSIGKAVWSAISSGAEWLASGAAAIGGAVWSKTKQGFNAITTVLGKLPKQIWDFMEHLPGMIADALPSLASGGVATGPTLATVGEGGPEAIIPLDRLEQMMQGQQGGGGATSVSISGGLAPFVEQVERSSQVDL